MADAPEPSMQLLAEAAQNQSPLPGPSNAPLSEPDDRSSGLSDIDDRPATEGTDGALERSSQLSEDEDTEAETERLEESPDKLRKHKQVLLSATGLASDRLSTPTKKLDELAPGDDLVPGIDIEVREDLNSDQLYPTSPMSSLEESADERSREETPTSSSSRKRKRGEDDVADKSLKQAALQLLANQVGDEAAEEAKGSAEFVITSAEGRRTVGNGEMFEDQDEESPQDQPEEQPEEEEVEQEDAAESNEEDVDMEDAGVEADTSARNEEELAKKKAALDLLGTIENDFALLRDRLFAERTQKLNDELASLETDSISHPDYLSMVNAIESQRRERVALARTSFGFKVKALQNKSVAERTYYHSQYMQSVRDIRDTALERANQEWYQIQRGRRALDEGVAERTLLTSFKRSDLVAQQNAYNTEVSILSGMAKWVGFPAAPEVTGASQSEMDDDLRKMGISLQPQQSHVSSSISQMLRQTLAAEKQFSKVTPWANAQHPQHTQNPNGLQHWNSARPNSPFTPATQGNAVAEPNMPNGSASTIAAPTPQSSEIATSNPRPLSRIVSDAYGETPSRPPLQNNTDRDSAISLSRVDDQPVNRRLGSGSGVGQGQGQAQSSPLGKAPSHLVDSDPAPRKLKDADRRAMGALPGEDSMGGSSGSGEGRLSAGFPSHSKMPAEVKVGMA